MMLCCFTSIPGNCCVNSQHRGGEGGEGILHGLTDSSFRVYWPAWSSGWRFARQVFSISPLHDLQKLARPNKLVRHVTQATGLYDSQNMGLALCQRTAPRQDVTHSFSLTTQRAPRLAHQTCMGLLNHIIIIIIIIITTPSSSSRCSDTGTGTDSGSGSGRGSGSDSSRIVKVVNIVFLSRVENGALNWWKWSKADALSLKAKIQ